MDFSIFGRGWGLGLAIAAPVGPIGILCIKRSLTQGWRFGLASGLGAATADGLYGSIAGFGLTALSQVVVAQQTWLRLGGGLFLIGLGLRALRDALAPEELPPGEWLPQEISAQVNVSPTIWPLANSSAHAAQPHLAKPDLLAAYGSTLLLTLTNPITILSFAALFAGLGITTASRLEAGLLISGVFCGSACWWLLLCTGAGLLQRHVTARQLRWIGGGSAGIFLAFGVGAIASLFAPVL